MSVKEKKIAMGYEPKPVRPTCSNCIQFRSEMKLSDYQIERNSWAERNGQSEFYTVALDGYESNLRCATGGFAVTKMATCKQWQAKP